MIEASRETEVKEESLQCVSMAMRGVLYKTPGNANYIRRTRSNCILIDESLFHHKPKVTANYIKLLYYKFYLPFIFSVNYPNDNFLPLRSVFAC